MKKIGSVVLVLFLLIGFATAQAGEDVSQLKEQFNQNSEALPGFVQSLVGDQDINLYVGVGADTANQSDVNTSGNYTLAVELEGLEIVDIREEPLEDPSLEIWVPQDELEKLLESDNPVGEFSRGLESGEIRYEVNGFTNTIKFAVVKGLFKLAGFFGFI